MPHLNPSEDRTAQQTRYTTCYMCACRCGIKVTLENGRIRFIEGNPDHPTNKGVLCAKGNAGIMKQASPAKLTAPLLRKPGSERGAGEFEIISWERALDILEKRLAHIRATDPKRLAFYTGRDQMQALTGFWASQFGTINFAAHGGFCSVSIAAAGLYTTGFSFWEFGEPDWSRCKYFMLWGVAEDHGSNPIKLGLEKVKGNGGKFVSINPVQTGYQGLADEWLPIRPGTDAMLALSMAHVLLANDYFDRDFLHRYSNASQLVRVAPGKGDDGLLLRNAEGRHLAWDASAETTLTWESCRSSGELFADVTLSDGTRAKSVMTLIAEACLDPAYAPAQAAKITGIEATTIERLALEMAQVAFHEAIELDIPWTDAAGQRHDKVTGRPVAMHAMRGISAHSNGFQTSRALHLLQALLGAIDCPGAHLAKPPFPKPTPPGIKPAKYMAPNTPLTSPPLGFPTAPEDLVIDAQGEPLRLDKAFSWEAPLAAHGMMQMAIRNAVEGDPYSIDTLMLFMANAAWNSSMNTLATRDLLSARDADGNYKIPFIVVADAFHSETVNYADLVLPDTTYLERHDTISLLDRANTDVDAVVDAIRAPVLEPDRDVRPFQEVLVELATRLGFPAFVNADGTARYTGYTDFVTRWEKAPGIGLLSGWRGADGQSALRGAPNPEQWQRYIDNGCFFRHEIPDDCRYYRYANAGYLRWAHQAGFIPDESPIVTELYSECLQKFRLAGLGQGGGPQPVKDSDRQRLIRYFTPLPAYCPTLTDARVDTAVYPFHAVNQRPMFMYHSWDSQNAWLRQIIAQNYLYMNRAKAQSLGIGDLSWVWVQSSHGRIRVQVKLMEGVESSTVWTYNAIGKQRGAWGLDEQAPEATRGFLMNHLIGELLPRKAGLDDHANADPVTGQAAWYDLRVNITPAAADERGVWPCPETLKKLPESAKSPPRLRYQTHQATALESPLWRKRGTS